MDMNDRTRWNITINARFEHQDRLE